MVILCLLHIGLYAVRPTPSLRYDPCRACGQVTVDLMRLLVLGCAFSEVE
jgi:hypothetical protein